MTPYQFNDLLENLETRLPVLIKQFPEFDEEMIRAAATGDPTGGKHVTWILRQLRAGNLRFATDGSFEDAPKVLRALTELERLKKVPEARGKLSFDSNQYQSFSDLVKALEPFQQVTSKAQQQGQRRVAGARLLLAHGEYEAYLITTPEAARQYAAGPDVAKPWTQWCTIAVKTAADYLKDGPLYVFLKNGKARCQAHLSSRQIVDEFDDQMPWSDPAVRLLPAALLQAGNPMECVLYARWAEIDWPEAEPVIFEDELATFIYGQQALLHSEDATVYEKSGWKIDRTTDEERANLIMREQGSYVLAAEAPNQFWIVRHGHRPRITGREEDATVFRSIAAAEAAIRDLPAHGRVVAARASNKYARMIEHGPVYLARHEEGQSFFLHPASYHTGELSVTTRVGASTELHFLKLLAKLEAPALRQYFQAQSDVLS